MTEDRKAVLTGGCQCGAVRYALYDWPERDRAHLCHCRMCQKAVGNVFAALAPVRRESFAWTRRAPAIFQSSSVAERGFCPDCGTPLSFGFRDSPWIDVTIGSLDQPERVAPQLNIGTESRLSWLAGIAALPDRETQAGSLTDPERRTVVSYQHPDHETDAEKASRRDLDP